MSPTAEHQGTVWRRPAPEKRDPARGLRGLLRTFHRWWARGRYRPERRYMRG